MTDSEKPQYLYSGANVNKSDASVETVTKKVNQKFKFTVDVSGNSIPPDESVSRESLERRLAAIEAFEENILRSITTTLSL
ncbi:MAG: hypothetical protein LUF26_01140 [Firmicutes bacterium]|nr:hypothetical protein [Bacillota bacterium]